MSNQTENPAESASSNPLPVDVNALPYEQVEALAKAAMNRWHKLALAKDDEQAKVKAQRIEALRAELAALEDNTEASEETPAESPIERFVNAVAPDPDPTDDPYPWFKMFGSTRIRPFEKHLLGEAALVVGQLAYQGIINLIPPKPLNGYEASDDLCDAIRQISGALWLIQNEMRLSELEPEKKGEYDVDDDDLLDVDKFAEPGDESAAE